ncbi:MAG: di-trans,poly-cis-decaprenylcistransferase [Proteobacteria bacterium]|nr:di-trans,poly-cis-decaprenylcistransferase [Pseudomonadota bacterium]
MSESQATAGKSEKSVSGAVSVEVHGDFDPVPKHVAIIMDGNHRWAKKRHLPGAAGHRAGARNVRPVAETCADQGVECLTLFAFSTENWKRPKREVNLLLDLMRNLLEKDLDELNEREVRLRVIGDRSRFSSDLQMQMNRAETLTRENTRMTLNIAANYGGRWDITEAARSMARDVRDGVLDPDEIDEQKFAGYLSLGEIPPPDLCIRTGGDHRISNFLLWDLAYTELYFTEAYWPDFDAASLSRAFGAYVDRQRRFGRRE